MGNNASELGKTLSELQRMRRLEKVDAARVQMARSMARALDGDPGNAALWRQYREVVKELVSDDDDGSVADALEELFSEVRDTPAS
jgi:ribosomal protein S18 acetylase RimI-like enzyme